jgi:hypothetical protein
VPADSLGIALTDIDSDEAQVSATTDGFTALTDDELRGTAASTVDALTFNYCTDRPTTTPCSGNTGSLPTVPAVNRGTSILFGNVDRSNLWGTNGASAWLRPSTPIKTIRIVFRNADPDFPSSERVFLVQKTVVQNTSPGSNNSGSSNPGSSNSGSNSSNGSTLASTGSNTGSEFALASAAFLTGFALLASSRIRRRRGVSKHRA